MEKIRYDSAATLFFGADPQISGFQRNGRKLFGNAAAAIKFAIEDLPNRLHGTRLAIGGHSKDLTFDEICEAYESTDFPLPRDREVSTL
jgi:hypothetical protein